MADTRIVRLTIVAATTLAVAAWATVVWWVFFVVGMRGVAEGTPPAPQAVAPAPASVAPAVARRPDPVIVREIRVLVACDEEVRRNRAWRERAASLVRLASKPWEREFGVRWNPVAFVEWTTDDSAATLLDLHRHLAETVSFGDAEVVLGLTGQDRADGSALQYDFLGYGDYFGRVAVAGVGWPGGWGRDPNTVAHELGHLIGAWHCAERDTIMTFGSSDLTRFDAQTLALVPLVRDYDFRAGPGSLDDTTIDAITRLWKTGHAPDAPHSVVAALTRTGWERAMGSDPTAGAADLERALGILASCGVTKGLDVSSCLVGLSQSFARRTPCDPVPELECARRARSAAANEDESPVANSWMQLGLALWDNGREAESVDAYAAAFKLRRDKLGATHGLTNDARDVLKRYASRGNARAAAVLADEAGPAKTAGASPR